MTPEFVRWDDGPVHRLKFGSLDKTFCGRDDPMAMRSDYTGRKGEPCQTCEGDHERLLNEQPSLWDIVNASGV